MSVGVVTKDPLRTLKLRNHHLTVVVWPEGGRILEVQSLRTNNHLVSWWPFRCDDPGRAGGIGEATVPAEAAPYAARELPDRISLTRTLPSGLAVKKAIYLPPDSLVFHVSISVSNPTDSPASVTLDQVAALCPGYGGACPGPDSGILHCRHKAFIKRPGDRVEEVPYEVFEHVHVERDDVEWVAFNDPISDNLVCALMSQGHVSLRSDQHWWLEWRRDARLEPGATVSVDFHYACTGSVDLPLLAAEHIFAGFAGKAGALSGSGGGKVRVFALDGVAAGNAVSLSVGAKRVAEGKPLPDNREPLEIELPRWEPEKDVVLEISVAGKYGGAEMSVGRCRELYSRLEGLCAEALSAADAGRISHGKVGTILATKRLVDLNGDRGSPQLELMLDAAIKAVSMMVKSQAECVPFYCEEMCRRQMQAARGIDAASTKARLAGALGAPYDVSMPRFRQPNPHGDAFALAERLLETALFLSVHPDSELLHLFKARFADLTALWAKFGAVYYETIHHGVLLSRLMPAYSIGSRLSWFTRADEMEIQAMILDLCAKIRRRGGGQFRLSNWWAMEAAPLAYAGALFPYVPEAREYLDFARESFYWLLVHGTLGDGGFWEMSPSYHAVTLEFLMYIAEGLLRAGEDLYGKGVCGRRLREMADFLKRSAIAQGQWPAFDDSSRSVRPEALLAAAMRFGDGELLWHAAGTFEREGKAQEVWELFIPEAPPKMAAPDRGSEALEHSGKLVLRSGCRNVTLALDYGPHGGWHGHNDKLTFELFWRDVCVVPDAGSYKYEDALHWSWFKTSAAHNTVTLGDSNQRPACGRLVHIGERDGAVTAAVEAATYEGVTHRREITMQDRAILIDDFLEGAQEGETIVWRMNSYAPFTLEGVAATVVRRGVRLCVTCLTEDVEASIAQVPLMPEEAARGGEYVMGWQLRYAGRVSGALQRLLTRLDLSW